MQKEELQKRYDELEAEKATLNLNSTDDKWRRTVIEQQQSEIMLQLKQQQSKEELESNLNAIKAGEEVEAQTFDFLEVVDFEAEYGEKSINMWVQYLLDQQSEQLKHELHTRYQQQLELKDDEIRASYEREKNLEFQNSRLQEDAKLADEKIVALVGEKNQLKLERDDFEIRFKNAADRVAELEEEDKRNKSEIQRLKDREYDLQQQLAAAPAPTVSRIDIKPTNLDIEAIREQREKEKASRPRIANLQWTDELRKTHYKAMDDQGQEVIFPRLELGKYNVVDEKELQFRLEPIPQTVPDGGQQADADIPASVEQPQLPEVPVLEESFPSQEEDVQAGQREMGGDTATPEVAGEAVSREELQALERRVIALEQRAGIRVA